MGGTILCHFTLRKCLDMEVDAEVMQTYPCFHCIEKDKRIAVLEDERDDLCAALSGQTDRAVVAEATIKGVRECKQYVAELPEIGKLAPVLRWRDVLKALGEAK